MKMPSAGPTLFEGCLLQKSTCSHRSARALCLRASDAPGSTARRVGTENSRIPGGYCAVSARIASSRYARRWALVAGSTPGVECASWPCPRYAL